jgi:hypothetical protein
VRGRLGHSLRRIGGKHQRNLRGLVLVVVAQQRADLEHPLRNRYWLVTNPQQERACDCDVTRQERMGGQPAILGGHQADSGKNTF